jgi:jasmonate ZIM domain-containing protein
MAAEHQQQSVKAGGGGGSRFAVTCGLLRQYMKEQGCVRLAPGMAMSLKPGADAAVAAAPGDELEEGKKTVLELFPQQPGTLKKGSSSQERNEEEPAERTAPLTIFYGGKMMVFDDFPAEKADELMKVAGGSCNVASPAAAGQPCLPDMPIARKVSLQRFLAKRKNRIITTDPPVAATEPASKRVKDLDADGAPRLAVNSMLSLS